MKLRSYCLIAIALVLAALPAQAATYQTFVLSNEGANGLVSQLVAAGYGNYNVYEALVAIQQNTNPSVAGIITDTFLAALGGLPASSAIFTKPLNSYSPGSQALAISTDGTVQVVSIVGAMHLGYGGVSTLVAQISGVGNAKFLSGATITSFNAGGNTYNVFGIAFSGEQTFVLSNEGTNGFITQLLAGGYGTVNLYEALVAIQQNTNPSVAGIITPAFLAALQSRPASSAIFTTSLNSFSPGTGGLAISTDGTVQLVTISGAANDSGTNTLGATVSGVGLAYFTHSTSAGTPLTSFTSGGTTYNVFGIGWMPGTAPPPATPVPPSLWLGIIGCLALFGCTLWSRRRYAR
jgi:hypothetical protein